MRSFIVVTVIAVWQLSYACLPGLTPYPAYQPAYSYNYPASYGVPFQARRAASDSHTNVLASTDVSDGCVTKFDNTRFSCATPFERQSLASEDECQKLCFANILKCQCFEFNTMTAQCDLYAVPPPEGVMQFAKKNSKLPFADEIPRDDYSYKKRSKRQFNNVETADPLNLPQFPDYCEPEVVPAVGTSFFIPNVECAPSSQFLPASSESNNMFSSSGSLESLTNSKSMRSEQRTVSGSSVGTNVIPETPDCHDGVRARIQLIDGIAFVAERAPIAKIQVESADVCLLLCRNNAYLDGSRFSRPCVSATFDRSVGRCTIMDDAIGPNGQLNYNPERDSVYFEKMCIPTTELPLNCDDVVQRIPQRVLDGKADATVDAHTQVECIRRCITASRQLGFTCQSATFYFEFPTQNCILNRYTRASHPDSFAAELRQKVDYMELAPCMITGWQQRDDSSMWSEWSNCSNALTRTRRRNCTDCDKREEQAPCVSSEKFKQEFPSISHQLESDLVAVPKKIANDFHAAQRHPNPSSKGPLKPVEEQALFGEHDYESQGEVSYFGPPHKVDNRLEAALAASMEVEQNEAFPDITKPSHVNRPHIDNAIKITAVKQSSKSPETYAMDETDSVIKDFENEHTKSAFFDKSSLHSSARFEEPETKPLGDGVGVVEFQTSTEQQQQQQQQHRDLPVKPASVMRQSLGIPMAPKELNNSNKKANDCDPSIDCCPLVNMAGRNTRGCTLGYRLNKDKQQEGCVPEACRHKGFGTFRLL